MPREVTIVLKFLVPVLLFLGTLYGLLQFLSDSRIRSKGEAGQLIYKDLSPGNPSVFPFASRPSHPAAVKTGEVKKHVQYELKKGGLESMSLSETEKYKKFFMIKKLWLNKAFLRRIFSLSRWDFCNSNAAT